ncbi:MAG: class II glutamine amidotransferase [Candidatus Nanopelagicales bacterium]|jgi:predicted glutamine amidotransferase|nr:class II glutamine amidotransferase [Candidatus Nanopelagicales bacterium]
MCRLLAWHSPTPLTAEQVLSPNSDRLAELSRVHCDGWGFAQLMGDGDIDIRMGSEPAHESIEFKQTLATAATDNGVVHLRWATGALEVNLGNTHPFSTDTPAGQVVFVHNGFLPDSESLLADIDEDLIRAFRGQTDSERYFGFLITELRHENGDLVSALRRTVKKLADHAYTSLNAMILTPTTLAVMCLFNPENRPLDEDPDYFDLTWGETHGVIRVWSSGVRPNAEDDQPLRNGTVLMIDTHTGDTSLVSIA